MLLSSIKRGIQVFKGILALTDKMKAVLSGQRNEVLTRD